MDFIHIYAMLISPILLYLYGLGKGKLYKILHLFQKINRLSAAGTYYQRGCAGKLCANDGSIRSGSISCCDSDRCNGADLRHLNFKYVVLFVTISFFWCL